MDSNELGSSITSSEKSYGERLETGIKGVDEALEGGISEYSTNLIVGGPGTGKSNFVREFLYRGVEKGERGLYINFEEREEEINHIMGNLGFDKWEQFVESEKIKVYDKEFLQDKINANDQNTASNVVKNLINKNRDKYSRLALDSLSIMKKRERSQERRNTELKGFGGTGGYRVSLLNFKDQLNKYGYTSMLVHEASGSFPYENIDDENYVVDGIIYLAQGSFDGSVNRLFWIRKMRRHSFEESLLPMEIKEGGIEVHYSDAGFMNKDTSL